MFFLSLDLLHAFSKKITLHDKIIYHKACFYFLKDFNSNYAVSPSDAYAGSNNNELPVISSGFGKSIR